MIEIGGILFKQPTDKPIVAYSGTKHVLIADGDKVERVPMSAYAESAHDHTGETIKPHLVADNTSEYLRLQGWPGGGNSFVDIYKGTHPSMGNDVRVFLHTGGAFRVEGAATIYNDALNSFQLIGVPSWRTGLGDAWNTYACSLEDKTNVRPILNAVGKIEQLHGITFTQDGAEKSGIPAEDLEKLELPDATHKEGGKFTSVNFTQVIPVLCEAVKELQKSIDDLKRGA